MIRYFQVLAVVLAMGGGVTAGSVAPGGAPVLDFLAGSTIGKVVATSTQVTANRVQGPAGPVIDVELQTGPEGYPGIRLIPDAPWDLSAYGRIDACVVNTSAKPVLVALRVDNDVKLGGNPWNTEQDYLQPGATGTITVVFGHAYGHKPAYDLNSSNITQVLLFTGKTDSPRTFRLVSLKAAGRHGDKPAVDPKYLRIKPTGGRLVGAGLPADQALQVEGYNGGLGSWLGDGGVRVVLPAGKPEASVVAKLAVGRWDLTAWSRVVVTLRNEGKKAVTPRVVLSSSGGSTEPATTAKALEPGDTTDVVVLFASSTPWRGVADGGKSMAWKGVKGTGTTFENDAVTAVKISGIREGESELVLKSVVAEAPASIVPEWLGKRPPVDGEWTMTLNEEFNGTTLDSGKWSNFGPNYWDRKSHWSSNNVVLGEGVVRIRYEKRGGFQNDDPNQAITLAKTNWSAYASGILETYGKWKQRYGYFEARMKLPVAPGLWPAFWLMPDRGGDTGPAWKRTDTADGGMEFDIMEHLTRWGVQRYNIAMHWDGYGKQHKMTGAGVNYVAPDKDGYITSGLLWEPGRVVFYGNGLEIARWECPRVSTVPSYILFTLPSGGWDNNALEDGKLPSDFVVDYVRVWQRQDLAGDSTR